MTWAEQAAPALAAAMAATTAAEDVAFAAAAIDGDGTVIQGRPSDAATERRFEIGSVTKTMTATVLALLAGEGVLSLDDPVDRWLEAGDNGAITVGQLATHTSGLPRLPPNLPVLGAASDDPWAGYDFDHAEAGLRASTLAADRPWQYSNLGYQLLALILQRTADTPFEQLLTERVLGPLAMNSSVVGSQDDGLLFSGHGADGPVPPKAHPLGAGGVEATIQDLARYARACLFPDATPLGVALARAQTPILDVSSDHRQALAWVVRDGGLREHSGGTAGFTACVSIRSGPAGSSYTDAGAGAGGGRAVALLASTGGSPARASHLKRAAQLALAGQDPRRTELPEPHPAWRQQATDMVRAMVAGDFSGAHARLTPARREATTPERLRRAWQERTGHTEPSQDPDVTIVRDEMSAGGAVMAEVGIAFADGPRRLRLVVLPDGAIGGLTFLS